jgi:DNA-binding transcriptional LysR family regulator
MDFHGFNLNLLVAFEALFAEQSVGKAANRLGLSQPAMSGALKQLRAAIGDELFVRSAKGLRPTARALELAKPFLRAVGEVAVALESRAGFDPLTMHATFRIALSDHPAHWLLPALAGRLARVAPGVDLRVHGFQDRHDAVRLLESGAVDVAVGVSVPGDSRILSSPLREERFVSIARKGAPSAAALDEPSEFAAAAHVLVSPEGDEWGVVDEALDRIGLRRRLAVILLHMYAVPPLVATTDHVATLMAGVVRASGLADRFVIRVPPVEIQPIWNHLFWHPRTSDQGVQTWFGAQIVMAAAALDVG